MWLILRSKGGYSQFTNFVEAEHADEYLTLFDETNKVRQVKRPTLFVLRKYVSTIVHDYLQPDSINCIIINPRLKTDMFEVLTDKIETFSDPSVQVLEIVQRLQVEMVHLMARDQLNRFLFSKFYKNWRANERGRAIASNRDNARQTVDKFMRENPWVTAKAQSCRARPSKADLDTQVIVGQVDLLSTAFANVHYRELEKMLDYQSWLNSFVASMEAIPLACAISRCSLNRKGFPLIFVNKQFEVLTGYKRTTVLGWQCKDFLQCPETEKDHVAILSDALKKQQVGSTILTNKNASGQLFSNLVCLRPVKDGRGNFVYVIALLFEVSVADSAEVEAKTIMAKNLVDLLPEDIILEKNEEESPGCWEVGLEYLAVVAGVNKTALENGGRGKGPPGRGGSNAGGRSRCGGGHNHHRGRPGSGGRPSHKESSVRRADKPEVSVRRAKGDPLANVTRR